MAVEPARAQFKAKLGFIEQHEDGNGHQDRDEDADVHGGSVRVIAGIVHKNLVQAALGNHSGAGHAYRLIFQLVVHRALDQQIHAIHANVIHHDGGNDLVHVCLLYTSRSHEA